MAEELVQTWEEHLDDDDDTLEDAGSQESVLCPLCTEELDITERNFRPCPCGYQLCLWCWNDVKEKLAGKCPACRRKYDDSKIQFMAPDLGKLQRQSSAPQAKRKRSRQPLDGPAGRTDLSGIPLADVRVIDRFLVYAVGLAPSVAKEATLRDANHFGKYGRIVKLRISDPPSASSRRKKPPAAYIYYGDQRDAETAVHHADGIEYDGMVMRVTFGTTKYCDAYQKGVPCTKNRCTYLHELANPADCLTKYELAARWGRFPSVRLALSTCFGVAIADSTSLLKRRAIWNPVDLVPGRSSLAPGSMHSVMHMSAPLLMLCVWCADVF